jgi:hypothetical protein
MVFLNPDRVMSRISCNCSVNASFWASRMKLTMVLLDALARKSLDLLDSVDSVVEELIIVSVMNNVINEQ